MSVLNDIIINPTTLTIITTYYCTSSCDNCCFQCNPNRQEKLSIDEMKKYIKESVQSYPSIKLLVLTGGESFVYGKSLTEIIKYAVTCKLQTRIVTNGFWAKNYNIACKKIKQLADAGLTEINFSTGDDHLKYVTLNTIKNATLASLKMNLTVAINVESSYDRIFYNTPQNLDHL